jgi:DNA-binding XRE family transcriptional regulator
VEPAILDLEPAPPPGPLTIVAAARSAPPKLPVRKAPLLLAALRMLAGATQAEVAVAAHCSQQTVKSIESGSIPSADLAARLEAVFGRPIRDLLTPVRAGELK